MTTFTLVSVCLLLWSGSSEGSDFQPSVYDAKIRPFSQCGQSDLFEDNAQLLQKLKTIYQQLPPRAPGCNPPQNCGEILRCNSSASSGYYHQIQVANGSAVQVYCDMEGTHCGGEGGWMRVAYLNMTDLSSQCPVGFRVETANDKRFCIRDTTNAGCGSMLFEPFGLTYSQVCGYVRGYSFDSVDAFADSHGGSRNQPLSGNYVDGVSISYGNPPAHHLWTYAAGVAEQGGYVAWSCPCRSGPTAPLYVGSDFYCESGSSENPRLPYTWHTSDPLWDGMQCGGDEGPCCNHTGLPWFNTNTPTPTTATINVRICLDEDTSNENLGVERLELFVK